MKFLTWLQPVLPQETLREKGSVGKRHHSSFQKGLGRVVTTKCCKVMAQNVKQGLAWNRCLFWKRENSVTWSTSLVNIFWYFLIYKVIYITNESWKYLVFTQIQLHTSMEYISWYNQNNVFYISVFPRYPTSVPTTLLMVINIVLTIFIHLEQQINSKRTIMSVEIMAIVL